MSVKYFKVPNSVIDDPQIDSYDIAVLSTLLRFNPSFPSYERIMRATKLSRERIWKSLKKLEHLGYIGRKKRSHSSNLYYFYTNKVPKRVVRQTNCYSSPDELY